MEFSLMCGTIDFDEHSIKWLIGNKISLGICNRIIHFDIG